MSYAGIVLPYRGFVRYECLRDNLEIALDAYLRFFKQQAYAYGKKRRLKL